MIKTVYLKHSGTAVIFENLVLVFDPEKMMLPEEAENRTVIFFVSHSHPDHFNPEILSYGEGRDNIYYCLSSDITETYGFEPSPEISVVKPDGHYPLKAGTESLEVETLGSTDRGVAFIVKYNGHVIYHAGDLNCWAWPGDAEETRAKEIADYQREVDKLKDQSIDLAFVPLDSRLEEDYCRGMDYFLETVSCRYVMPIHMWERYDLIPAYKASLQENQAEKILETVHEMQAFELDL